MAIVLGGISMPLDTSDEAIRQAAAKKLHVTPTEISGLRVKRQSVDSRRAEVRFVYTLHVTLGDTGRQQQLESKFGTAAAYQKPDIAYGSRDAGTPVIVGCGPCGLFAALTLAEHGYKPLLIERGRDMNARERDVAELSGQGILDTDSNVCFGAGGAGAFSDGKLTTRIKDARCTHVLDVLADCGAPDEIRYMAKPHMGTENVRAAVSALIERICTLGGTVRFSSKLVGLDIKDGALAGIDVEAGDAVDRVDTRAAVLAIGHSARDTYGLLAQKGIMIAAKPFAVGLRIEHPQAMIDDVQYGAYAGHPRLGAAEYRLSTKHGKRGVYTFCMCPGGQVICSATEPGGVAVNGMSHYRRDGQNANSAVVATVSPDDFGSDVFAGIEFQRRLERMAYDMAGGYGAPAQRLADFLDGRISKEFGMVTPSFQPYVTQSDLHGCLPPFAADAIKSGIVCFGKQLKGFDMPDAVLTGVETRTSAPVRILRQEDMQSTAVRGVFPAGEGAGYAGGIVSAAVDGIRCAEALMRIFAQPR